jgi:ribose transport system substrate-binding protein
VSLSRRHRTCLAVAVAFAFSIILSACGGVSNSSSSTSPTQSSSAVAKLSGTQAAEVAAAKAFLAKYENPPTSVTVTSALPSAPPKGDTIVYLNCGLATCTAQADGVQAAAKAVGWNFQEINYDTANPATLTAAFEQALNVKPKPVAVVESGNPPDEGWSSVLPAYKAAGIAIVASYIGATPLTFPIIANVGGPSTFELYAQIVANWFIADSDAQGKAVVETIDSYPVLADYSNTLLATIKAGCTECNVSDVVANTAAEAGSNEIVPSIVSALKRDSAATYLLPVDYEFIDGLPSALSAAGIHVTIGAEDPDLASLGYLKDGTYDMAPSHPSQQAGWLMADAAFRYAEHLPISAQDEAPLPSWILTASRDFPTGYIAEWPSNYQSQYEKLWDVG